MKPQLSLVLLPLALLASAATAAAVEFTTPSAGAIIKGGGSPLDVEWRHLGNNSNVPESVRFDIFLCAGGDDEDSYTQLAPIVKDRSFAQGNSASGTVAADIGGNSFLQMIINWSHGAELIHSPRFSLSSMTGSFPEKLAKGLQGVSGTASPPTANNDLGKRQAALPYEDQKGPTRYAPVPMQPPTKISLKTAAPLHPKSAFNIAQSFLPRPTIKTTISVMGTFVTTSIENTAAPAPTVDDDMQRFLNRWKD
ncbi:hypothetical protein FQN53_003709 [Emmonsiellopsis sp. PD_33]|nr:hypothetical protein FQN53_003709 [Emmonsiellopsis sp. PD_33]